MRVFSTVKVGIMMEDKRLEYRIMEEFKKRRIPFVLLNTPYEKVDVVVSDIPRDFENTIIVHDEKTATRRVTPYLHGRKKFYKIVVGIDPGPKPGLAVVGDGIIVEEMQLNCVDKIRSTVDEIYEGYKPQRMIVRVGNGDIVNRNKIVNSLLDDYTVELVDERGTSSSITNRDIESAKTIAFSKGKLIKEKLTTNIRDGYVREIQRRSRIESNGMITISKRLAKRVILGEITMHEAIELARRRYE